MQFARIGKALANSHRLELLDVFAQGERSVEALAHETGMSVANASHHLQLLRAAQVVDVRREGVDIYYRLADERVFTLWQSMRNLGEARIAEIDRVVQTYLQDRHLRIGHLQPGERVVDVGSGAGIDSLIATKMVAPDGQVIGVDMTPAMLEMARKSAHEAGSGHVEFREGLAESLPVLMLTARDAQADQVQGLESGADDYVIKPFTFEVLLAHVRSLLRRQRLDHPPMLRFADLSLDTGSYIVPRGRREISLTSIEFKLLEEFLLHPRQVLSKNILLDRVWGYDFDANIVEVYVKQLRQKLESEGEPRLIQTIRNVGYVLREQ